MGKILNQGISNMKVCCCFLTERRHFWQSMQALGGCFKFGFSKLKNWHVTSHPKKNSLGDKPLRVHEHLVEMNILWEGTSKLFSQNFLGKTPNFLLLKCPFQDDTISLSWSQYLWGPTWCAGVMKCKQCLLQNALVILSPTLLLFQPLWAHWLSKSVSWIKRLNSLSFVFF